MSFLAHDVASKDTERAQLAALMAEFESRKGKISTQPAQRSAQYESKRAKELARGRDRTNARRKVKAKPLELDHD